MSFQAGGAHIPQVNLAVPDEVGVRAIHFSKMIKDRVDWVSDPMECVRGEKQKNYSKPYFPT